MENRKFRPYEPDQMYLLPPSLKDWMPEGHLAYFVMDVVRGMDISKIIDKYGETVRGTVPYDPEMIVSLLVYGYSVGIFSSRKIAMKLEEDVAFRVIAGNGEHPNFRTISDFRKEHLEELKGLFVQVLKLCEKAGMVKLGKVAIDGTKLKANASKHKAMSYERMEKEEIRLKAEVEGLLKQANETDRQEDVKYGNKRGDELPEELAYRESRLRKIKEAKESLEQEAREAALERKKEIAEQEKQKGSQGKKLSELKDTPNPKAQRNFTDAESRIMPSSGDKKSFVQGYNCQAAVDGKNQVIVAEDVTQETNDRQQAVPMLKQVKENTGRKPKQAIMDAGYYSGDNIEKGTKLTGDLFISPNKQKHNENVLPTPRGRIPKTISVADRMRRKLKTKKGLTAYAKRKEIVEPVFGQIKQVRGFRQFLLRGLKKVKGEWSLICTTHNILKLWRYGSKSIVKSYGT